MRSFQIVVDPPVFDDVPGMAIAAEQVFVEAFISKPAVDGEDGPAPEKGQYAGPTYKRSIPNDPNHRGP